MKKLIVFLFLTTIMTNSAYAVVLPTVSPTPTKTLATASPSEEPSPTPSKSSQTASPSADVSRIEKIKEMVAQKVAKLNLVEKKGILGKVREGSTTQITVDDAKGEARIIDIDELTKFSDPSQKSFGVSDISKDDVVSAVGLYNKDTKRLLARFVTRIKSLPVQLEGIITEKTKGDYTLTLVTEKNETLTIDIGTSTRIQEFVKDAGMKKSGFSKVEVGQRILATGYYDTKNKKLILASRVIHFSDVPTSDDMKKYGKVEVRPTEEPTPTNSTIRR